jgi:hypothetical protein
VDHSVGHTVSFDPSVFHVVGVAFHAANVLLCFLLVQRLTRRRAVALLASLVFALHPLQLESVAWISELRGLSSSFFALLALNALVLSRQGSDEASARSRVLLAASALFVTCAMLCKPAAAVLPMVALAIDRIVLGTSWRRAAVASSIWAACTVPFAWITHSVQAVAASTEASWWQRPFVAGDALTFYLFKTFVPIDLCVDYGRTPRLVMSHAWGYLTWAVPAGLLVLCYRNQDGAICCGVVTEPAVRVVSPAPDRTTNKGARMGAANCDCLGVSARRYRHWGCAPLAAGYPKLATAVVAPALDLAAEKCA